MTSEGAPDSAPGAAVYSIPLMLRFFYDHFVLGISSSYIWRAAIDTVQLPFFRKRASSDHLDIGVGTGYYLANANFPADASVTLCDLNPDSLATARRRILHLKTDSIHHDIFKPLPTDKKYASISLMYLFHCLPGPPGRKASIFGHLKRNLQEGGVLFGSTVLGKGVEHNLAGRTLMKAYNGMGTFGNCDDSADVFLKELKLHFDDVDARIEGVVLLFTARGPIWGLEVGIAQPDLQSLATVRSIDPEVAHHL